MPEYTFVDIASGDRFTTAKPIAGGLPPTALRPDGSPLEGKATVAYIVTPEGRAANQRFVSITDEHLRDTVIAAMNAWRFEPGRLDGEPLAILALQEFDFKLPAP